MKRIIVCGCRDWPTPHAVETELERVMALYWPGSMSWAAFCRSIVIVHGACDLGADYFTEKYAQHSGLTTEQHPADWKKHGKAAGPIRNRHMASLGAELCLAFWDGESRGTLNMIQEATRAGIPVRIVPKEPK